MSSLAALRAGLAARFNGLTTTTGTLTGYARTPSSYVFPAAVVGAATKGPVETFNGDRRWTFDIKIHVLASDPLAGQPEMDPLLSDHLANSVEDAIEGDPSLGGACDSLSVLGFTDPGEWEQLQGEDVLTYVVKVECLT